MADKIARSTQKKYHYISFDELQAAAYMGLVQAANSYDQSKNAVFEFYAIKRIFGAIKDYAKELPIIKKFIRKDCEIEIEAEEKYKDDEIFDIISKCLSYSEKQVVYSYYFINENTREIADKLELHQSRISQILSSAEVKMRDFWCDRRNELYEFAA